MTIAVTGSSGHLGRLIVENLRKKVQPSEIVAIARTPAKAADLRVAVREADYSRPSTVATALHGVNELVLVSGNEIGQRAAQHLNVIAAARAVGVRRVIYTSLLHADRSPLSLAAEHLETERTLKESGLAFTILRNGWYNENYTNAISTALETGAVFGSAGQGRISAAARSDYAEAAVAVVTTRGHDGKTYELAGDDSFTLSDLAAELSRRTGRRISYKDLPEAEYASFLEQNGLAGGYARALASWDVGISAGALFDDGRRLGRLIGRRTVTIRDFVGATLGEDLADTG